MKKRIFGRQFKRDINERKALFKSLMSQMLLHEKIETSQAKAKAIKAKLERLVTKAKKRKETAFSYLLRYFPPDLVHKLIKNIAPRFANKPGGYLRIIKLNHKLKDNSQKVRLEWTEEEKALPEKVEKTKEEEPKKKQKKTEKVKTKTKK